MWKKAGVGIQLRILPGGDKVIGKSLNALDKRRQYQEKSEGKDRRIHNING